jgi:phosphoribosylcarboxyaminoimidazole (NCAIR) mutase
MPGGVPVATMAIGAAGAMNAGLFAARVLALGDAALAKRLEEFRQQMVREVEEKNARLQERLGK